MDFNNWIPLEGGSVNSVDYKDGIVRRKLTKVSPAIHQLLKHLEAKNLSSVPRLLNYDDDYEYLSYFPGSSITRPWDDAILSDEFITRLGQWLKDYHDAVTGFRLKDNARFDWRVTSPKAEMIICHGDLGPWNCIQQNGEFQAIIDWDLAHYGYAMDDVAELAFEFIPMRPYIELKSGQISGDTRLHRLKVFCQAYGQIRPVEILEHIPIYITRMNTDLKKQASLGIEPFVSFVAKGIADKLDEDKAFIETHWLRYQINKI